MLIELSKEQQGNLLAIVNTANISGKDAEYIVNVKNSIKTDVSGKYELKKGKKK